MGDTSLPLDGFEGASEVWPRQRDTRIPVGTWETWGCLALSQLRTSVQEKHRHRRSLQMVTSETSTQMASSTAAGVDIENRDLRLKHQKK